MPRSPGPSSTVQSACKADRRTMSPWRVPPGAMRQPRKESSLSRKAAKRRDRTFEEFAIERKEVCGGLDRGVAERLHAHEGVASGAGALRGKRNG
jgi:hypothetical protein